VIQQLAANSRRRPPKLGLSGKVDADSFLLGVVASFGMFHSFRPAMRQSLDEEKVCGWLAEGFGTLDVGKDS